MKLSCDHLHPSDKSKKKKKTYKKRYSAHFRQFLIYLVALSRWIDIIQDFVQAIQLLFVYFYMIIARLLVIFIFITFQRQLHELLGNAQNFPHKFNNKTYTIFTGMKIYLI